MACSQDTVVEVVRTGREWSVLQYKWQGLLTDCSKLLGEVRS